ncbi:Copper-exporting P-type ATPase A [compost metagenome]
MLDRALVEKPRLALLADRVAGWFVGALLAMAAVTGVVWAGWIDPSRALLVTVAVLVVSCSCALSLATPAALAAA